MSEFDNEYEELSRRLDAALGDLQPQPQLEERIIGGLPRGLGLFGVSGFRHPLTRRAAAAVAAAVLLGGVGYTGLSYLQPRFELVEAVTRGKDSVHEQNSVSNKLPLQADTGRSQIANLDAKLTTPDSEDRTVGGLGGGGFGGFRGGKASVAMPDVPEGSAVDREAESNREGNSPQPVPPEASGAQAQSEVAPAAAPSPAPGENAAPMGNPSPLLPEADVAPATQPDAASGRKIIRNGEMTFEVESFDAAYQRLSDIVRESGGFIGSTDSQRLPNGKLHGTVTIRVPPENLDALILKLRALGDLKQQQIAAQDITKEYTDLQSELHADQAMVDRLMELIRTTKGQMKDLLAVENELGNWRTKVDQVTGQINYYNNLVSLSTLQVTLAEKDIGQAALATETGTVNANLEADDVAHARDEVSKSIDAANGRITKSDMKEQEDGQYMATIVAEIPPDAAGAVLDRIKQLGSVSRLEVSRQQLTSGEPVLPGMKIERRDTVLNLSIFNLASIWPRQTISRVLVAADAGQAYQSILDAAKATGAKVRTASLHEQDGTSLTGELEFDLPADKQAALDAAIDKAAVMVSQFAQSETDSDATTDSKVRLHLQLAPLDQVPPRRTVILDVQTPRPEAAAADVISAALADGAKVLEHSSGSDAGGKAQARLVLATPLAKADAIADAARSRGTIQQDQSSQDAQAPNGAAAQAHLEITFASEPSLVADDNGLMATIKQAISTSIGGLLWSLGLILIGIGLAGPWALITGFIWFGWRWLRGRP